MASILSYHKSNVEANERIVYFFFFDQFYNQGIVQFGHLPRLGLNRSTVKIPSFH